MQLSLTSNQVTHMLPFEVPGLSQDWKINILVAGVSSSFKSSCPVFTANSGNYNKVEMVPDKPAVETMVLKEFNMELIFSVAIGQEFVPILNTGARLSAKLMDWSAQVRSDQLPCYTIRLSPVV